MKKFLFVLLIALLAGVRSCKNDTPKASAPVLSQAEQEAKELAYIRAHGKPETKFLIKTPLQLRPGGDNNYVQGPIIGIRIVGEGVEPTARYVLDHILPKESLAKSYIYGEGGHTNVYGVHVRLSPDEKIQIVYYYKYDLVVHADWFDVVHIEATE